MPPDGSTRMLPDNGEDLVDVMYRMSIVVDTDVNDDRLLTVAFVIHIVELVLHLLSLLPSLVITYLLVGKPVFQINIRIFMWNILGAFYMQWAVRTAIFALTLAELFDDPSAFGPLRILHITHECALMAGVFTLTCIAVDRIIATWWAEEYEETTSPRLGITLILLSDVVAVVMEVHRYFHVFGIIVVVGASCVFSALSFNMLVYAYKWNKYYLRNPYSVNLNKKFQLRENIQICVSLLPSLIFSAVVGVIGGGMIFVAAVLHINISMVIITSLFHCGLCLFFVACPTSIILATKKYRLRILFLLRKNQALVTQHVSRRPPEEERNLYFNQLEKQWS